MATPEAAQSVPCTKLMVASTLFILVGATLIVGDGNYTAQLVVAALRLSGR